MEDLCDEDDAEAAAGGLLQQDVASATHHLLRDITPRVRVAVLMGGPGREAPQSLASARTVVDALRTRPHPEQMAQLEAALDTVRRWLNKAFPHAPPDLPSAGSDDGVRRCVGTRAEPVQARAGGYVGRHGEGARGRHLCGAVLHRHRAPPLARAAAVRLQHLHARVRALPRRGRHALCEPARHGRGHARGVRLRAARAARRLRRGRRGAGGSGGGGRGVRGQPRRGVRAHVRQGRCAGRAARARIPRAAAVLAARGRLRGRRRAQRARSHLRACRG